MPSYTGAEFSKNATITGTERRKRTRSQKRKVITEQKTKIEKGKMKQEEGKAKMFLEGLLVWKWRNLQAQQNNKRSYKQRKKTKQVYSAELKAFYNDKKVKVLK